MAETSAEDLADHLAQLGISFIPFGPLASLPARWAPTRCSQAPKLAPRQALAWLLRRSPNIIVIPGTTSVGHLEESWRTREVV